jgi:Helix-turn-helix domain
MARGRKSTLVIQLSTQEREILERWQRTTTLASGLARRGRIILLLAEGYTQHHVAQVIAVRRSIVRKWAKRFLAQRIAGLHDGRGCGLKGGSPHGPMGARAPGDTGP